MTFIGERLNGISHPVGVNEDVTSPDTPSTAVLRTELALGTAVNAAFFGAAGYGIASAMNKNPQIGLIVGSALPVGFVTGAFGYGFMCGLFEDKETQARIEEAALPRQILTGIGSTVVTATGAYIGSKIKNHPTAGAFVGASVASGVYAAAIYSNECPKIGGTGQ